MDIDILFTEGYYYLANKVEVEGLATWHILEDLPLNGFDRFSDAYSYRKDYFGTE